MSESMRYCLDANIIINASRGPYGFDIAPSFWGWLDRKVERGIIYSSLMVLLELEKGNDDLVLWAKDRKNSGLFLPPTPAVQKALSNVVQYVSENYQPHKVQPFLDGADPWVIAQALVDGSCLVSFETMVDHKSSRVKIPNICQHFDVRIIDTYAMLRECGARL